MKKVNGLSRTRIYFIYHMMKQRCNNENCSIYNYYGGRGIKVCKEWQNDFMVFYHWAMNNGYKENLTLDRIDTNGDYKPNNCRWITRHEQTFNLRNNKIYTINGVSKCLAEWCIEYDIPYQTLRKRLERGFSIEEAVKKPIEKKYRNKLCKNRKE